MMERRQARLALGLPLVVALLAPSPRAALTTVSQPPGPDATAPLLAGVALAAWACSCWLTAVVVGTWLGRLPGPAGATARRAVRRLAPASVRGLVRLAVGTSVAASVLTGPSALAEDRGPAVTGSLDWPGAAAQVRGTPAAVPAAGTAPGRAGSPPGPSAGPVTAPSGTPAPLPDVTPAPVVGSAAGRPPAVPPAAVSATHPAAAGPAVVVVQAGDSLWSIAARALGPRPRAARVAQAWPQWWQANRAVVGDDPDLIRPGTRLTPPAAR